jgi:hydrogenase expression/formation protein HypD
MLISHIRRYSKRRVCLMEVCGTHTMSVFRNGIRSILPKTISLLSGPGCPVCVTAQDEIDAFISLAREPGVIITTFGDLMRVPGTHSNLQREKARGGDIRVVYSTVDALDIAEKNPRKRVVFLGVGFETTAPTIAAALLSAQQRKLNTFTVLSAHKRVPPALTALLENDAVKIDGFLLPGHVSVVIGEKAYMPFFERYEMPCAITGFEPADILQGILSLVRQIETDKRAVENCYGRAVTPDGNKRAQSVMNEVFKRKDAMWRGLGVIPESGFEIRQAFSAFDARKVFRLPVFESMEPEGCACGEVLTGAKTPLQCRLYKSVCTPMEPVGPCMVSSEGTCAAYYRYHAEEE